MAGVHDLLPTVAIVGPTAAGKASLGLEVAERLGLPIVVCDSVKVYRRLDIGSAKPSAEARARVPHVLIDVVDPDVSFSAGDYARHALAHLRQGPGLIVGGTGLYLRATAWTQTAEGTARVGAGPDDPERIRFEAAWRAREQEDPQAIHRALAVADPETAATIHPNNVVRALRALWMCDALGVTVAEARRRDPRRPRMPLMVIVLDPGPQAVRGAIERRTTRMLAAGWVAEVENLAAEGYDGRFKAMRSVGYRQLLDVVEGRTGLQAAKQAIVAATSDVARRQRTFFRNQLDADVVIAIDRASDYPWDRARKFLSGETT